METQRKEANGEKLDERRNRENYKRRTQIKSISVPPCLCVRISNLFFTGQNLF